MPLSVAIVGAGPSGFYTAEALIKRCADCRVDIIESLPTPYGLIRSGVAPDHQSTKRVTRAFERTALREHVNYFGNVEVGKDVSLEELREIYDAVVLAVGAALDRSLGVPGDDKVGVYGAAAFVGWYNGHPDYRDLDPDLNCSAVAVIGNGNVALDVARVLSKTAEEMATGDLPKHAASVIHDAPIRDIHVFGRRGAADAKWTNVELREMGELQDAVPLVDLAQIPDGLSPDDTRSARDRRLAEKNLATLRSFASIPPEGKRKRVHFTFCASPIEVLGDRRVEGLRLERNHVEAGQAIPTGDTFEVGCGLVIASIGYRSQALSGMPFDAKRGIVPSREGRVAEGLYVVGWAKRGPSGVIGSNKPDADLISRHIEADIGAGGRPGGARLAQLLDARAVDWVSFEDWKAIEAAETAAAQSGAPRQKLIRIRDMLAVLEQSAGAKRAG